MILRTGKYLSVATLGLLGVLGGRVAMADPIFNTSNTFAVIGTNAPDNFTTTGIVVGAASTLIDSGKVDLTQSIINVGGGNEWIVWKFETVDHSPIAGNVNANWTLEISLFPLNGDFIFEHFFNDWGTNGVLTSPTNAIGSNNPLETNPITGIGKVFGKPLDLAADLAGGTSGADTFSGFLTPNGFDVSNVDTFEVAEEFGSAVPEPESLALFCAGLLGLTLLRRRNRRISHEP